MISNPTGRASTEPPDRGAGFTLVELLIVLAIIVVLAALLLPAVGNARNRARTVTCANNQKQLGVGMHLYVNDNGAFPYLATSAPNSFNSTASRPFYLDLMTSYLIGVSYTNSFPAGTTNMWQKLTRCPANPSGWVFPPFFFSTSYPVNTDLFPATMCFEGGWTCNYGNTWAWNHQVVPSDIQHPAEVLLIGECPVNYQATSIANTYPWYAYNSGNPTTSPFCDQYATGGALASYGGISGALITNYYWAASAWSGWYPARVTALQWLRPDCNENVSAFHNLSMNCLHVDGHVKQVSRSTLFEYACEYYIPTNPPMTSAWSAMMSCCGPAYEGPNTSPGGIFFTDGKQSGGPMPWYSYQFPNNGQ